MQTSERRPLLVSKGWVQALKSMDSAMASTIMRLKKEEAKMLDTQHRLNLQLGKDFGEFSVLMDESAINGIPLPDREMAAYLQHQSAAAHRHADGDGLHLRKLSL